jgi:hypothetical protein
MKEILVGMHSPDAPVSLASDHWRIRLQELVNRISSPEESGKTETERVPLGRAVAPHKAVKDPPSPDG